MNKLRFWLLRHGIEFEGSTAQYASVKCFRSFNIIINHRYIAFDIGLDVSRGVFTDELNTPHAEIAAQYERGERT